jgi:chromatin assembly factor 1 subunit B
MKRVALEVGKEQVVQVDLGAGVAATGNTVNTAAQPPSPAPSNVSMSGPGSVPVTPSGVNKVLPPPSSAEGNVSTKSGEAASSKAAAEPATSTKPGTGSVFALPYRMLFAVATQDTVMIYDTQQAGPICMFTNLHYSSFTDMAWYVYPRFPFNS